MSAATGDFDALDHPILFTLSDGVGFPAEIDTAYHLHPDWTVQLLYDNLQAQVKQDPTLDPVETNVLCALYPLDKKANAQGRRRTLSGSEDTDPKQSTAVVDSTDNELPALFKKMIADYSATGLPTAYIPLQSATTPLEV